MAYRGKYYTIDRFDGGECSLVPFTQLAPNQASSVSNIFVLPDGKGFRSRGITAKVNTTEFGAADSYPVIGVGILETSTGTSHVLAIKKGKAYGTQPLTAGARASNTFTDRTGAVTISTSGTSINDRIGYRWTFCQHGDVLIGFGGSFTAPDAPFKWTGETSNIAALGGSPPSAKFGFAAGNRVFAGCTAADPATLYWSILGNAEDWTGAGSGNTIVGNLDDGDPLQGAVVLSRDIVLLFKSNSVYSLDLATGAPFAPKLLFSGVGAINHHGIEVVDGVAYFLTTQKKLMATDGNNLIPIPASSASLSNFVGTSLGQTPIKMFRLKKRGTSTTVPDYDVLMIVGINSAADADSQLLCPAWDLLNKCWLNFRLGFQFISGATHSSGYFYGGWANQGRIYMPDYVAPSASFPVDDTGVSSGAFTSFWQSGWLNAETLEQFVHPQMITAETEVTNTSASYDATLTYDFDYASSLTKSASLAVRTTNSFGRAATILSGRGNLFMFRYTVDPTSAQSQVTVSKFQIRGKPALSRERVAA
jgi:hypothetical protein